MTMGDHVFGLPIRVVSDVPYFALLASVPLYAVARYGRDVWRSPGVRVYLVPAYLLYGLAGVSSGVRHLGDFYIRVGRSIDEVFLGGRFPVPTGLPEERAHFLLVDSLIEESVETMAAACFLATVLACVAELRRERIEPPTRPPGGLGRASSSTSPNPASGVPQGS